MSDDFWQNQTTKKLGEMSTALEDIHLCQVEIQKDVEHHVKRTDLLEEYIRKEIPPIKNHVVQVRFVFIALKYIASLSGLIAIAGALFAMFY